MYKNRKGINYVSKIETDFDSVSKIETNFYSVVIFINGMYSVSIFVYIYRNKIPLFLETVFL